MQQLIGPVAQLESIEQLLETASYSYTMRCNAPYYALRTLALSVELLKIRGSSAGKLIPQDLKPPYSDEYVIGYATPISRIFTAEAYAWRYHLEFYRYPVELRPLQRVLAYQRPETCGF